MITRNLDLKSIRTDFMTTTINDEMSSEEHFQNLVLRPIIKFQKFLFIGVFKNYIKKHKSVFYELSIDKRIDYIENAIKKDIKFRNSIKGMILGLFTVQEYNLYILNSSALNKRMMRIAKESLINNIKLLEHQDLLKAI